MSNLKFTIATYSSALAICFCLVTSCNSNNKSSEETEAQSVATQTEIKTEKKGGTSRSKKKEYDVLPLDKIKLPKGFKIALFAEDLEKARSLELSPKGTLFVGTMSKAGVVTAVKDTDGDMKADQTYPLSDSLQLPNGVAFKDGDLYVAEVSKIRKYTDIENNLDNPQSEVIFDQYPTETHHGWKFIDFGPDGKLYVPVGAPCNICLSESNVYASITRLNTDGSGMEVVQHGVRNTVGFTWHPDNGDLWFTDNGRDWMGEDIPGCEVNRAPKDGLHFGYPYCHQGNIAEEDDDIPAKPCSDFVAPAQILGAHVAALGIEFIPAGNFPESYNKHILIAEHGSWNRTKKSGYRVMLLKLDGNQVVSYEPFAEGWLEEDESVWGRPVDLEFMSDGSMLLSDDMANVVYRIYYTG